MSSETGGFEFATNDGMAERARESVRERAQARVEGRGAAYRGSDDAELEREPDDAGQCQTCGNDVPKRIGRVVGDEHGRVPDCPECHPTCDKWFRAASTGVWTRDV